MSTPHCNPFSSKNADWTFDVLGIQLMFETGLLFNAAGKHKPLVSNNLTIRTKPSSLSLSLSLTLSLSLSLCDIVLSLSLCDIVFVKFYEEIFLLIL